MTLRTRKPTGLTPWPVILVEGAEKAGKSVTSLTLSASERIAASHLFEIGERTGDAYADLGDYEIVDLDGTWSTFVDQYGEAATIPVDDEGRPTLNVVDSGTVLWESLKDWISDRAANSQANRRLLSQDPDAAITIGNNLWNDANNRWGQFMRLTKAHQGITVITARSKITAKIGANGAPVAGQTEYKIEAQKDLPNNVSAIVRCDGPGKVRLMAAWKLGLDVPANGIELPAENPLEHLVFDILGAGGFGGGAGQDPAWRRAAADAKNELVEILNGDKATAAEVWKAGPCPNAAKTDEVSDADWHALEAAARERLAPPVDDAEPETAARPAPPVPGGEG